MDLVDIIIFYVVFHFKSFVNTIIFRVVNKFMSVVDIFCQEELVVLFINLLLKASRLPEF